MIRCKWKWFDADQVIETTKRNFKKAHNKEGMGECDSFCQIWKGSLNELGIWWFWNMCNDTMMKDDWIRKR